jgi:multiple sugar transport system substrate-binding protein
MNLLDVASPRREIILIALIALLLLALSLSACGERQEESGAGPVTIIFKHAKHPRYQFLATIIEQFQAENPAIRVQEEILPSSSDEQHQFYVMNLAGAADDFDVLDMDVIWVPEFARAGWLVDLTDHFGAAALQPINQAALQADYLGGRLYAAPWFIDAGVLYYRRDLLDKYGFTAPRTYPELVRIAQHILRSENDPRLNGFLWQGMQYEGLVCAALEFIRGNGGDLVGRDSRPLVTEAAALQALQFMSDLIRRYGVTPALVTTLNEEACRHIFQSGRAVFMRNWPYAWRLLHEPDSPIAGRVGMTIVPHFPGHASAPTLGGFHLGVSAFSRHKAEAAAFVRFMIRREVQKQIMLRVGVLAADMSLYSDPDVIRAIPFLPELLPALEQVRPRPVTPYYLMMSQLLQGELSAIVAGIRAPAPAMHSVAEQVRHLLRLP